MLITLVVGGSQHVSTYAWEREPVGYDLGRREGSALSSFAKSKNFAPKIGP